MALINRLSRLFHADMNAVLDQIEDPQLLLKQATREMEETLYQNERNVKLFDLEQQKMLSKKSDIKQAIAEIDEQLNVCFESDKDDIARSLIKRKLETVQYLKSVAARKLHSVEKTNQLKIQLEEQRSQLSSMKQKADIFNQDSIVSRDDVSWNVHSISIQDEDVEVAF